MKKIQMLGIKQKKHFFATVSGKFEGLKCLPVFAVNRAELRSLFFSCLFFNNSAHDIRAAKWSGPREDARVPPAGLALHLSAGAVFVCMCVRGRVRFQIDSPHVTSPPTPCT